MGESGIREGEGDVGGVGGGFEVRNKILQVGKR